MRSKYNVSSDKSKRTYNNIVFDSELEMRYYRDVVLLGVQDGTIKSFELQKEYILQEKFKHDNKTIQPIKYVADFFIEYSDGHVEVLDTKGLPDSVAVLKRKMFWYVYPDIEFKWIGYSKCDGGWCDYEHIKKQRALRKKNKKQKENK